MVRSVSIVCGPINLSNNVVGVMSGIQGHLSPGPGEAPLGSAVTVRGPDFPLGKHAEGPFICTRRHQWLPPALHEPVLSFSGDARCLHLQNPAVFGMTSSSRRQGCLQHRFMWRGTNSSFDSACIGNSIYSPSVEHFQNLTMRRPYTCKKETLSLGDISIAGTKCSPATRWGLTNRTETCTLRCTR